MVINNAGELTDEFRGLIRDLTFTEELLVARCCRFITVWMVRGHGQLKYTDDAINPLKQKLSLAVQLPRVSEEVDVVLVRKADFQSPEAFKDFIVYKSENCDH